MAPRPFPGHRSMPKHQQFTVTWTDSMHGDFRDMSHAARSLDTRLGTDSLSIRGAHNLVLVKPQIDGPLVYALYLRAIEFLRFTATEHGLDGTADTEYKPLQLSRSGVEPHVIYDANFVAGAVTHESAFVDRWPQLAIGFMGSRRTRRLSGPEIAGRPEKTADRVGMASRGTPAGGRDGVISWRVCGHLLEFIACEIEANGVALATGGLEALPRHKD